MLDTRFPASRIKKIMQADEDVGKIAMAVPLLVSKALELFLQDLCNRTYEVTLQRRVKTLNSLHLKQCVQNFNVFDFLRDTVSKVPDLGSAEVANEDRSATKRRKISEDEECGNGDGSKRMCRHETNHTSSNGRGRGRGRGSRTLQRGSVDKCEDLEDGHAFSYHNDKNKKENLERPIIVETAAATAADSSITDGKDAVKPVVTFDLNVKLNKNGDSTLTLARASSDSSEKPFPGTIHEDIPRWSIMESLAVDTVQLSILNKGMDEEDEDYNEEG